MTVYCKVADNPIQCWVLSGDSLPYDIYNYCPYIIIQATKMIKHQ